jgi:allantoin racemase
MKINFINPFGTPAYDALIVETLVPYARADTELVVTNIKDGPPNIDFYYSKHILELRIFEEVMRAEEQGFDAVIVGCCYDPGVRAARELVDIPVIGPLEASIHFASYYGHDYVVVTDHDKALPYLRDMVHLYGGRHCRGISAINWWVTDMIKDTAGVARDALAAAHRELDSSGAEVAILACTIISASTEKFLRDTEASRELTILNPNTMALKMAESLADLKGRGLYNICRKAYYRKMKEHNAAEFADVRAKFGTPGPNRK